MQAPPYCRRSRRERLGGRRRRLNPGPAVVVAVAVGLMIECVAPAFGQQATSLNGPPVQVQPTAMEPGVPAITIDVGTPNPFPSPGGGGPDGGGPDGGGPDGGGPAGGAPGGGNPSVAGSWDQYAGRAVGTGQCVALVQAADPTVGFTGTWVPGAQVQGNTNLVPGTIIATFNGAGHYANAEDGSSHAAIYLGQNAQGIQVLDQSLGYPAAYRTIYWSGHTPTAANTGGSFRVVTH